MDNRTTPESIFNENNNRQYGAASTSSTRHPSTWVLVIGVALITGVGGFVGGMQVNKSTGNTSSSQAAAGGQASGRPGGASMMGSIGAVTAVSDTSITVKDTMQGTSKTFTIDSSTTVTESGSSSSLSAIAVGDTVAVQTATSASTASSSDTSSSSIASAIEINPTIPSGGSMGGVTQ